MIYWRCQLRLSFFSFFSAASSWMIDYCRSFRCGFPFFPERLTPQATEKSSSQGRFGCCFLCEVLRFFLVISTYYPNICSGIWWYNNIISWGRSPKAATRTDSPFFHVCILWKIENLGGSLTEVFPFMWGDDGSSFIYEIPRRCTGEGFFKKMVYKKFNSCLDLIYCYFPRGELYYK